MMNRIPAAWVAACLAAVLAVPAAAEEIADRQARAAKAVEVLKSGAGLKEKQDACRELARVGGKAEVPVLAGLLGDEKLSHMARHALEPIPDPAVDEALREAAGKVKGRPLVGVLDSIGIRKDAQAVGLLAKLLGDADAEVAVSAAISLGRIGTLEAAAALEKALGTAPPAVLPAVCDGGLRAAESLVAQGKSKEAIALYDRLRAAGMPKAIRTGAMRGAVLARGPAGHALLVEALGGNDPDILDAGMRLIYEIPGKEATQAIAGAVKGLSPERQVAILLALGNRGDSAALPAVLGLVKSGPGPVRDAAVRILPQLADASAVPMLFELCDDAGTAKLARASLAALPGADIDAAIVAQMKPDGKYRLLAMELAGERRAAAALPAVLKAVDDAQDPIRLAAVRALEFLAGPEQRPVLARILGRAKDPAERLPALRGLVRLSGSANLPVEKQLAFCQEAMGLARGADEKKVVLAGAAGVAHPEALALAEGCLGDAALKGDAEQAMFRIAMALSGSRAETARTVIEKLAASATDDNVKKQAQRALRQLEQAEEFVTVWQVSGPYHQPGKSNQDLFGTVLAPEKPGDTSAKWRTLPAGTDSSRPMILDLLRACGGEQQVAYVRTWVRSEKEQPAKLLFGTDDGVKVWLNDKEVFANPAGGAATPDKYKTDITLKSGWNALLLKVTQDTGPWEFCLRITTPDEKRLRGLQFSATPPAK